MFNNFCLFCTFIDVITLILSRFIPLLAAGGLVIGGLLTRDKFTALSVGMSGFDGMIQGFGEGKWRRGL